MWPSIISELLNIPYVGRLVETIKKVNAKIPGHKEEIIELLDVFEKPKTETHV